MGVEYVYGRMRGRNTYRLADTVNSLCLGTLSRLVGLVKLVTPSNDRVHHAKNPCYIDRNYGGVFTSAGRPPSTARLY